MQTKYTKCFKNDGAERTNGSSRGSNSLKLPDETAINMPQIVANMQLVILRRRMKFQIPSHKPASRQTSKFQKPISKWILHPSLGCRGLMDYPRISVPFSLQIIPTWPSVFSESPDPAEHRTPSTEHRISPCLCHLHITNQTTSSPSPVTFSDESWSPALTGSSPRGSSRRRKPTAAPRIGPPTRGTTGARPGRR